ncbi:MAG: carboxylesterase/lipase family protein [Hyphomonas sp.]
MQWNRRLVLIGGAASFGACASGSPASVLAPADPLIVETAQGRYRGAMEGGVQVFRGMRYGASTEGRNRFRPPRPPEPWAGVRDATAFGDQAPQSSSILAAEQPMSEDCLRINIWTPAADSVRRPVLLWFHGGGFEAGASSIPLYNGAKIARRGDVVVATINHRLNVFGHCYLADALGEDFAQSGNTGYLDLVAAMKWVRENIGRFGGDPNNVMIYGQSGGGRKVSLCFAGREAEGLFHKGVVQSGSHLRVQPIELANELSSELMKELGIPKGEAIRLQTVPLATLSAAQLKIMLATGTRFSPVLDGHSFTSHPYLPDAPAISSHIPMMLGTTRTELTSQLGARPGIFDMDKPSAMAALAAFLPAEDIREAFDVFQASRPEASPSEVFFTIASARGYVRDQTIMAENRIAASGSAPTYVYRLMWRSPVEGGRRVSQHSLDLPFIFDTVDTVPHITGPETEETRAMVDQMAETWLAFAKTGDPNHAGIPAWAPYDLETRPTMMFDLPPTVQQDPHAAERSFMARYETQQVGETAIHRRRAN